MLVIRFFLLLLLSSCASSRRPRPEVIEDCKTLKGKILERDRLFDSIKGRLRFSFDGQSVGSQLAIRLPNFLRAEMLGPFNLKIALLMIDPDWVYFYIPRKKQAVRLPFEEMKQNTLRRQRFLKILPLPFAPEALFDVLLSRVGMIQESISSCHFDEDSRLYKVWFVDSYGKSRIVEVDPFSYHPISIQLYGQKGNDLNDFEKKRPEITAKFKDYSGQGLATHPASIHVEVAPFPVLTVDWLNSELWDEKMAPNFVWRPTDEVKVIDY